MEATVVEDDARPVSDRRAVREKVAPTLHLRRTPTTNSTRAACEQKKRKNDSISQEGGGRRFSCSREQRKYMSGQRQSELRCMQRSLQTPMSSQHTTATKAAG